MPISTQDHLKIASSLWNASGYYLVEIGLNGLYLFANPLFEKTFIEPGDTAIGKPYTYAIDPADLPFVQNIVTLCLQEPSVSKSIQIRKPIKNKIYLTQWEFTCHADEQGNPTSIICIGYDITESATYQHTIEQYLYQINEYLDSITDGFFTLNKQWEFARINKVFEKIAGKPRKEMLGKNFWNFFPVLPNEPYSNAIQNAMKKNETTHFEQAWTPNRIYSATVYPSKEGIICYIKDITYKKQKEEELKESQLKLKAILDSTVDSNTLVSIDKKVLSFNRAAKEQTKIYFSKELKIGAPIQDYIPRYLFDDFEINFNKALQGGIIKSEQHLQLNKTESVWVEFFYHPVFDETNHLLGVSINSTLIDERKKAELKVLEQYEQLKKIAYLQSHELRAPLTNIMGSIDVLSILKEKISDPELLEVLDGIKSSAVKMDEIIKKIVRSTVD